MPDLIFEQEYNLVYKEICHLVAFEYDYIDTMDKFRVRMAMSEAIKFFLPEFKKRENVPLGQHFYQVTDIFLSKYGISIPNKYRTSDNNLD